MLNSVSATAKEIQEEILLTLDANPNGLYSYQVSTAVFGSSWSERITANLRALKKKGYVSVVGGSYSTNWGITAAGSNYVKSLTAVKESSGDFRWTIKGVSIPKNGAVTEMDENWEPFDASGNMVYFRQLVEA
jgi:hypothetical protein